MPEGHTIHRLARDMQELTGAPLEVSSPQGKFAAAADDLDGRLCTGIDGYGKHLLVDFEGGSSVHVHLGMRGKVLRFSPVSGAALKQVRLRLRSGDVAWDLIAPSACDLFDPRQRAALIEKLGPDPLRSDADVDRAIHNLKTYVGSIGAALTDQAVVAGVGNVFRAEVLHRCRIHPLATAAQLQSEQLQELWSELQLMMKQAVDDGRIITVDSDNRSAVPEAESRRVYKQEHCYDCSTEISTQTIEGRTAYWCPKCQVR